MSTWDYLRNYLREHKITYNQYLQSEHWHKLRQRKINSGVYKCYICGFTRGLSLHHKTYKRIGREYLMDLIWLCEDCHIKVHKLVRKNRGNKKYQLWYVTKTLKKHYQKYGFR